MCVRTSVCFPQFYRVTGQPPCFSVRPPARSLVLNFLRRGFATSETAISISTILFLLRVLILRIFYRHPLHLYNPAMPYPPSASTVLLSVTLVVFRTPRHSFLFHPSVRAFHHPPPRSPFLFAILSIPFAAHLNAWRTTWDKKGIHGRATRRTPETQIYFFNTVNITVPGDA